MKKNTKDFITVWLAHGDGGERSMGPVIGIFSTQYAAECKAKGAGWYGGNGDVTSRSAIKLNGKTYLLDRDYADEPIDLDNEESKLRAETRAKAIKKLDPDEIEALGLNDSSDS